MKPSRGAELVFGTGRTDVELKRPDGWFYRLSGVVGMEFRYEGFDGRSILVASIRDVSDETLASVKVLRDELPEFTLQIEHDVH